MATYTAAQTQNSGSLGEAIEGEKIFTITNSKNSTGTYSVGYFTLDGNSTSNQNLSSNAPMAGVFSDFTGGVNHNSLIQTNTRFSISIYGSGGSFKFTPSTPIPANSYYVKGVGEFDTEISVSSSPLPLNGLTGSTGAFSLRKLESSYSGNAIQVRRASDNTTQDIGFVNNQLDTTTLNSFCSGTDGFVTIWYNQSDTNNNAIQTASSNQPKIYDSSTGVELENGKPAINFIKANSNWLEVADNTFGHIQDAISNFSVFKINTGTTFYPVIFSKSYSANGGIAFNLNANGTLLDMFIDGSKAFNGVGSDIRGSQVLFNNINLLGSNGLKMYIDSTLISQQTTTQNLTGTNTYKFAIGRNNQGNSYYTDGTIQEIILFSNDQTSNKTTIETDINTNYSIY